MASQDIVHSHTALAVGLLSLLIGYVGADVAPNTIIERILWPQRASNGFGTRSTLKTAFFLPAGGPLYRVALSAIDSFFKHSLQKGAGRGHMLGTAFFPDTGIAYKMHPGSGQAVEDEWVRNGLLVRILKCIPYIQPTPNGQEAAERRMRQRITVSHLELSTFETVPPQGAITLDDDYVNAKQIFAIVASEIPALILCVLVALSWDPLAAIIFLAPLALKVLAAATTIQREELVIPNEKEKNQSHDDANHANFEIHIPGEGFQVISGPSEIILPFFRHYGHPIRCRWREITQMLIVAAIGASYPVTLAAVILFMPNHIRTLWLLYQVYVLLAMLVARYGQGELWGSTEERVGQALVGSERAGKNSLVVLKNRAGEMIGVKLTRTVHGSYTDGRARVAQIVAS